MADISFSARPGMAYRERFYKLTDACLVCETAKATRSIPYGDVAAISLLRMPMPGTANGYGGIMTVRPKSGGRVRIYSQHYPTSDPELDFEDRSKDYARLARALFARVAKANPKAKFFVGGNMLRLAWGTGLVLMTILTFIMALLIVMHWFGVSIENALGVHLGFAMGAASVFYCWKGLTQNKPRNFPADNPPRDMLFED